MIEREKGTMVRGGERGRYQTDISSVGVMARLIPSTSMVRRAFDSDCMPGCVAERNIHIRMFKQIIYIV